MTSSSLDKFDPNGKQRRLDGIVFSESYPVEKPESKPITYGVGELASPEQKED